VTALVAIVVYLVLAVGLASLLGRALRS